MAAMIRKIPYLLYLVLLTYCGQKPGGSEEDTLESLETPPSYLSFRINFPVSELENGVNSILPKTILDDKLPIKGKDTLILHIVRKGRLSLAVRQNEVFASIPLEVEAAIKKKVMGITFSNEDTPIKFSGTLKASAKVELENDWNFAIDCEYKGFDLGKNAEFSVMGITFNIDGSIEKALDKHKSELSNVICQALGNALDFRQVVNKVWADLQNPQRIAMNPTPIWLYSKPIALNGKMIPKKKDTLSVHLEYRTVIEISPDYRKPTQKVPLTDRGELLNVNTALVTYPKLILPYEMLTQSLKQELVNQHFTYEGYNIQIEDVFVGHDGQKLRVDVKTTGDIKGVVIATGVPALNENRELYLEDFGYEITSKDDWVKMVDWAVHQFAEDYIEDKARMDTKPFFDGLDQLIMDGLAKSKLAPKMDVQVSFDKISNYKMRMTSEALEWIFYLEGEAALTLKKGLFEKNR